MSDNKAKTVDSLISARWIIPVVPEHTILENHSIVIDGGVIVDILPNEQALSRYDASHGLDFPEHVLTPGLINSHGHAAMSLFRGMADDYPLQTWLEEHIWPAEGQWVSEEFVRDGTELAIIEMLRSGTTTFSDMYFFPDVVAQAASDAGMRAQITFPVFDFPTVWGQGPDDYIRKGLQVRDDFKHNDLIDVVFGPHSPYTVGDEAMKKVAMLAAELDINVHIHVHETQLEVDNELAASGQRPLQKLAAFNLLTPRTQLVHMTALTAEDIELVRESGAHIVHCPNSNMKLASGSCPLEQLQQAGINISLGTDGAASNNSLDLFSEMRSAAMLAKLSSGDAAAFDAWQTLKAATLGGARAMGIEDSLGSLEVGKQADIIAVDMSSAELQPVYNPLSQLVYNNCGQLVSHSWINGQLVLADREPTQLKMSDCIRKAKDWRDKINTGH